MRIKCYYRIYDFLHESSCEPYVDIIDIQKYDINYAKYLFNFLMFNSLRIIKSVIKDIEKIEKNEMEVAESAAEIPDIYIYREREKVLFEHNLGWYDDWECPTSVVKQALEGWKKFLEMPRDKDTTYEFEIDDSDL